MLDALVYEDFTTFQPSMNKGEVQHVASLYIFKILYCPQNKYIPKSFTNTNLFSIDPPME